jgi:hypothetical protein
VNGYFVILCRRQANDALATMRAMMERLKLTVNETNTHVCLLPAESFDFLGYALGRMVSPRTGGAYLGATGAQEGARRLPPTQRVGPQVADGCAAEGFAALSPQQHSRNPVVLTQPLLS